MAIKIKHYTTINTSNSVRSPHYRTFRVRKCILSICPIFTCGLLKQGQLCPWVDGDGAVSQLSWWSFRIWFQACAHEILRLASQKSESSFCHYHSLWMSPVMSGLKAAIGQTFSSVFANISSIFAVCTAQSRGYLQCLQLCLCRNMLAKGMKMGKIMNLMNGVFRHEHHVCSLHSWVWNNSTAIAPTFWLYISIKGLICRLHTMGPRMTWYMNTFKERLRKGKRRRDRERKAMHAYLWLLVVSWIRKHSNRW